MSRIRHCVECPKCFTRYLISFSPYRNGSYLVPIANGSFDEYSLYCSCGQSAAAARWRWSEVKACEVSKAAYERGYGSPDEILLIRAQPGETWSFDVSEYMDRWASPGKRRRSI